MKITSDKKEEILFKTKILNNAIDVLKKEFIGIDSIIDQVINSIKPYYFFSEYLRKPLVVNLWGLTGTGKTSLIKRLSELLEFKNKLYNFDCGEYVGYDYKLKYDINDKLSSLSEKNLIFLFDEFQLCRTINEDGKENDRIGLRPLWEIIDSGITYAYKDQSTILKKIYRTISNLADNENDIEIENGVIIEGEEIFDIFASRVRKPCDYSFFSKEKINTEFDYFFNWGSVGEFNGKLPFLIKYSWLTALLKINPSFFTNLNNNEIELINEIEHDPSKDKSYDSILELLNKARSIFNDKSLVEIKEILKKEFIGQDESMKKLDFSQSLIFCIGNLDEAYQISNNINPDADADLFHNYSLKISVPLIKKSLAKRFRMEQISRLGNNHIIYPSLSKNDYKKIIKLYLNQRIDIFKNDYSIDLKFTKHLEDLIYKEGVFPTQGVRPVLSTINNQIDSYISRIISDIMIDPTISSNEIDEIKWNYNNKTNNYEINLYSKSNLKHLKKYSVNLLVEKLRKSDKSEEQLKVAVHEAGHAIVSIYEMGIIPLEIVSKTADCDSGGFCTIKRPDIITKNFLLKEVMVLYGGIEAENLIFGIDNVGVGAFDDIRKATEILFSYHKRYGMDDTYLRISTVNDESLGNYQIVDSDYDKKIKDLSIELKNKTTELLTKHKKEIILLSSILAKKPKIKTKEIVKILNLDVNNYKNNYTFKDKFESVKSKLNIL